jgi:DNA-binding response OmpR family regulator
MTQSMEQNGLVPRILVVDDEQTIVTSIVRALELSGYRADGAASGKEALRALNLESYDLMLLDIKMPEIDGIEVMHRAHQLRPELAVIILTGHATLDSAIAAIKSEAEDYLLKPAGVHDIAMAIGRTLKKRSDQARPQRLLQTILETLQEPERTGIQTVSPVGTDPSIQPTMRVGKLQLDLEKRLLVIDDPPIRQTELTDGEARVLTLFMKEPNRVLSCREITRAAWDYDLEEWEAQALVRPYIFRLRQKVESNPSEPQFIRTVRGRGYGLTSEK